MLKLVLSLLLAVQRVSAYNSGHQLHGLSYEDELYAEELASAAVQKPSKYMFEMPIDHFNTESSTYKNHFWLNDTYYKPGGPIFLFDHGERGVHGGTPSVVLSEIVGNTAIMSLARRYNGAAILWEHRFYGQSQPFELDDSTGKPIQGDAVYKYLTIEQALEDLVYFPHHFVSESPSLRGQDLSPSKTPWIILGGSYPGVRAALLRLRNEETWFAGWASSAPVQAQIDMSTYFRPIEQAMPRNCSADIHAAVEYADEILQGASKSVSESQLRNAVWLLWFDNRRPRPDTPASMTVGDIGVILAFVLKHSHISFQNNGFDEALRPFCDALEQYDPRGAQGFEDPELILNNSRTTKATTAGLTRTYKVSVALEALLYATFQNMRMQHALLEPSMQRVADSRAWTWQYCNEFGYFRGTNQSDPSNLISRFVNVTSIQNDSCYLEFPDHAPRKPNTQALIDKYQGWKMTPSNVMFTNGALDPWRTLGVHSDTKINPGAFKRSRTTTIPTCGQPPADSEVFGLVYPDAVHGQDMIKVDYRNATGPVPLERGLNLFTEALDAWLPCFKSQMYHGLQVQP